VQISIAVNHETRAVELEGNETLLDLLRERLGLTGAKRVCDLGECGQCTVLLDGAPANACILLAASCRDCEVETIEGLDSQGSLNPLQRRLAESGGLACGFCAPAWVMALQRLFEAQPDAGEAAIRAAAAGVTCRCDPGAIRMAAALLTSVGTRGSPA